MLLKLWTIILRKLLEITWLGSNRTLAPSAVLRDNFLSGYHCHLSPSTRRRNHFYLFPYHRYLVHPVVYSTRYIFIRSLFYFRHFLRLHASSCLPVPEAVLSIVRRKTPLCTFSVSAFTVGFVPFVLFAFRLAVMRKASKKQETKKKQFMVIVNKISETNTCPMVTS